MPEKFLAIEDFDLKKGSEILSLKKGKSYTKKELIKFLEKEGTLNFKLKCTKLKNALIEFDKDVQELIKAEPSTEAAEKEAAEKEAAEKEAAEKEAAEKEAAEKEAGSTEGELMFLANKQIKQDKKVLFKKGQKIAISELKDLDISKLVEEDFLTEIKIVKETENKE